MSTQPALRITGMAASPREFTHTDLAELAPQYQIADVSSIDSARAGRGVWLWGLLELVSATPQAHYLGLHASKDEFHASIPLEPVRDRGYVIFEHGGEPLMESAGGPFRFAIRDFAACHAAEVDECANVKFVDHIELTAERGLDTRPQDDASHEALHRGE